MLKKKQSRSYGSYVYIAIAVLILDQITKSLAKGLNESVILVKDFLDLTFITNTGSAFGILKGFNTSLIFISLIVIGIIIFYWDEIYKTEKIFFALIVGGIIGNLIDRVFYGFVIDFINFSFWPAFNVADSAITIGVIALIIYELKK